jgi:integrase
VEWNGRPVQSAKTAFRTAVRLAQLKGKISPHTLRHTAATWLKQAGVDKWEAAGFLSMSVQMLDRVYASSSRLSALCGPCNRLSSAPIIANKHCQ